MAPTRKSAKRAGGKKRSAKRGSTRKRAVRKTSARRGAKSGRARTRKKSPSLRKKAEKGLKVARSGIETVREAGDKAWSVFKSTTAQVVEGVKDRFAEDTARNPNSRE